MSERLELSLVALRLEERDREPKTAADSRSWICPQLTASKKMRISDFHLLGTESANSMIKLQVDSPLEPPERDPALMMP